jgi:hypothetical protein
MMIRLTRFTLVLTLAALTSACALSLRHPNISELQRNPARYQNHSVSIEGVVTSAWGVPFVPFRLYKVDDGTGEVTVLSSALRTPTRGAYVRVTGRVDDVAVVAGRPVGLHLNEENLRVRR